MCGPLGPECHMETGPRRRTLLRRATRHVLENTGSSLRCRPAELLPSAQGAPSWPWVTVVTVESCSPACRQPARLAQESGLCQRSGDDTASRRCSIALLRRWTLEFGGTSGKPWSCSASPATIFSFPTPRGQSLSSVGRRGVRALERVPESSSLGGRRGGPCPCSHPSPLGARKAPQRQH